jgi:hypothetical protein
MRTPAPPELPHHLGVHCSPLGREVLLGKAETIVSMERNPELLAIKPVGITPRKLLKVLRQPRLAAALLNAQIRIRGKTAVPLSVRLRGKIRISGGGRLVLGHGITLVGNVVPIEFVAHQGACITIGDHTFVKLRFIHFGSRTGDDWAPLPPRPLRPNPRQQRARLAAASDAAAVQAGCDRRSRVDRIARVHLTWRPHRTSLRDWCR